MSVMKMPTLTPQIIKDNLARYADLHGQDEKITEVMQEAKKRGYMTTDDLVEVAKWLYPLNEKCEGNDDKFVEKVTKNAFATDCDKKDCITILKEIHGVGCSTASVILHFYFPEKYPILTQRAMNAVESNTNYNFDKWQEYSRICREACAEHGLTMRNLDRVLWQMGDDKKKKKKQ